MLSYFDAFESIFMDYVLYIRICSCITSINIQVCPIFSKRVTFDNILFLYPILHAEDLSKESTYLVIIITIIIHTLDSLFIYMINKKIVISN